MNGWSLSFWESLSDNEQVMWAYYLEYKRDQVKAIMKNSKNEGGKYSPEVWSRIVSIAFQVGLKVT